MGYDLESAAIHIVHDHASLLKAGQDTQNALRGPYNHYAERTFLVHCRAFSKFYSNGTDTRDMYAIDFVDNMPAISLPVWDKWHKHIDQHLMHLTISRTTNKIPWTGEPNKVFLREFKTAWTAFYGALKPSLKSIFDRCLSERQILPER
jgi:hypothetical protein